MTKRPFKDADVEIARWRRMLELVVQQVDMPENDDRTLKTFRGGTVMEQARKMLNNGEG